MAGVMVGVDQRTQLVGRNRLELLLFRLSGKQKYGINVFKVQEVMQCPALTHIPNSNPVVRGVSHMRGKTIAIIDLGMAIGQPKLEDLSTSFVIVAEYNRLTNGFLVDGVERISNLNWKEILAPPKGTGFSSYLSAVTHVDGELIEILDVEKVLSEVMGESVELSDDILQDSKDIQADRATVLVVDDSYVARNQIKRTLENIGVRCLLATNGKEAFEFVEQLAESDVPVPKQLAMVIADIEMPVMDGYTFTSKIKDRPEFRDLYILLHTSLSGIFNEALIKKVGADEFVPKFNSDDLAKAVLNRVRTVQNIEKIII